jgi:gamma-glutamyl:cysteine ligase YbdK (ATP-grasp superfamily)
MTSRPFHLFERYGVELEYMIVDAATLDVRPISDRLVHTVGSARKNEVRHGALRWSNELVMHVIELKTDGPSRTLDGLETLFLEEIRFLNGMLGKMDCRLLPTAMHPWMDPHRETRLWPHGSKTIYQTFDRIFDCRGHGWSNLQSTHLNLPFATDEEFRRLHTAIRVLLPLLPALAASSPFMEGRRAPLLDMRLEAYRHNCDRVPSITGHVVPEWIATPAQYQKNLLQRIYRDLAPLDPDEVLKDEWVNARGAIARFDRQTIEIRVLDIQECPRADLAILQFIVAILKGLVSEDLAPIGRQKNLRVRELGALFVQCATTAEQTVLKDRRYLQALGIAAKTPLSAADALWSLLDKVSDDGTPWRNTIEFILKKGSLSRRILKAVGPKPTPEKLSAVYAQLADGLQKGDLFEP